MDSMHLLYKEVTPLWTALCFFAFGFCYHLSRDLFWCIFSRIQCYIHKIYCCFCFGGRRKYTCTSEGRSEVIYDGKYLKSTSSTCLCSGCAYDIRTPWVCPFMLVLSRNTFELVWSWEDSITIVLFLKQSVLILYKLYFMCYRVGLVAGLSCWQALQ